jgi:hypothetical protein
MEVHQTEFLQAVVLAGAVALATAAWDNRQESVQGTPTGKAETRKDRVRANAVVLASKTRVSRDTTVQQ